MNHRQKFRNLLAEFDCRYWEDTDTVYARNSERIGDGEAVCAEFDGDGNFLEFNIWIQNSEPR